MRFHHPQRQGRALRLGYCMNLAPADTATGVRKALTELALPLRERLGCTGVFGVGLYLPGSLAQHLDSEMGRRECGELAAFLSDSGLDAFTFNAFPFAGFGQAGLKERVFRPDWTEAERVQFSAQVTRLADALARQDSAHISISTHAGGFGTAIKTDAMRAEVAENLACFAAFLATFEERTGRRVILSIEPEPRSSAGDTQQFVTLMQRIRERAASIFEDEGWGDPAPILSRHLGSCFDTCHSAVEFEDPLAAFDNLTAAGVPIGKVQLSNAIALANPGQNVAGRERLLAMDEPAYLHQVTGRKLGRSGEVHLQAGDLPELAEEVVKPESPWLECEEWRCHYHVPVDFAAAGDARLGGLSSTAAWADRALEHVLAEPERWGSSELQLEIETYTWDLLADPNQNRSQVLVDGLEREYRHVLARLEAAGWQPA